MALLSGWPSIVDDDGSLQTGTVINKSVFDSVKSSVENATHSATNPTLDPNDITDEVVTARGSKTSLDGRLSVSLNPDGTLITPASLVTQSQLQQTLAAVNLVMNDTFLIWHSGDSAAPTGYVLSGAGATIARTGTGLTDTERKVGKFAAKVTYGSATATLMQTILDAGVMGDADILRGQKVGLGAWVKTNVATHARLRLDDGIVVTNSSYHTGSNSWEWLSIVVTLNNAATKLDVGFQVEASGSAYISGLTLLLSDFAPPRWLPSPKAYNTIVREFSGDPVLVNTERRFVLSRPALVKEVHVECHTAVGGASLIVDVDAWDGAAWQSMFVNRPTVAAASGRASAQPDGTYQYRCFTGSFGGNPTGSGLRAIIDQAAGTGGKDPVVSIRVLQYLRPLEDFLAFDD